MQMNTERCPKCGKYTSVVMWNPTANAAVPAIPTVYQTATSNAAATSVGSFYLDGVKWNNAMAAKADVVVYDLCTCPSAPAVGFIDKRG